MTTRLGQWVLSGLCLAALFAAFMLMAVGARAAPYADMVIDARTGEVLRAENADTRLHPASLTKMMTLYIAFEAIESGQINLDSMVTVSTNAANEQPSRLGLRAGQRIAMRYLIRAAAVKSANDAATAIGEGIEGSEAAFARRMNRTAAALGMTRTTFKNAHGLTESGHLSTARDMTTLGRRLFYDFPQYYHLFSRRTVDAGVAQVAHTNRRFLDAYEGADGIKTGYTAAAGFNLVASAERGRKRIIATVFGGSSTASRNARVAELLDLGFNRAPNRARVKKPDAPLYLAEADLPPDPLEATAGDPLAAGKRIRVSGTVTRSPRPHLRPQPAATVVAEIAVASAETAVEAPANAAAMQSDINAALSDLQLATAPAPEATPAATPDAAAPAKVAVAAVPAAIPAAAPAPAEPAQAIAAATPTGTTEVAELTSATETQTAAVEAPEIETPATEFPADEIHLVQTTAPQPETLDLAATTTKSDPAAAAGLSEVEVAAATSPLDDLQSAIDAAVAEAMTDPDTAPAASLASAQAAPPLREPTAASARATAAADPVTDPVMVEFQTTLPQPETTKLAALLAEPAEAAAPTPPAAVASIVLAAATASDIAPAEQEIVSRVSSSGGRLYAINVGRYPSRFEAERVLLQTALTEIDTLGDGLRKVVARKGGFEANFVGLSQQTAALACDRLSARGGACTVVAP